MDVIKQPYFLLTLMMIVIVSSSFGFDEKMHYILYITPTCTSSCPYPTKPCLTLSQFAANTSWLKSNTTLMFLPGNHTLNSEISISNISNLSMLPNSTLEDSFQTVICQQIASFKFENIDNLMMKGLKLLGCYGNKALSIKSFTLENSTFQGQDYRGTAASLEISDSVVEIKGSYFISNTVGSCLQIFDLITDVYARVGGVLFVTRSSITIMKSNFVGNGAEIGGAIFSHQFSNITITDSTFVENRAAITKFDTHCSSSVSYRDVLRADLGSDFIKTFCSGGVTGMFQSRLVVNGSTFSNNTSEGDTVGGGASVLSIQFHSAATINGCDFQNNSVNGFGGALIIAESNVTIESSTFYHNSADHGGVMYVTVFSAIVIRHSNYSNNSATSFGGVIASDQNNQLMVIGSRFIDNRAAIGGALSTAMTNLSLWGNVFSSNQATGNGGVMYVKQNDINFRSCNLLADNFARDGGAIYAIESTLTANSGHVLRVMSNTASGSGGGLYLYRSNLNMYTQYNGTTDISGNRANNSGGGIHAINSLITVYCDRLGLSPYQGSIKFTGNMAHKGGGICLESAAQLRIQKIGNIRKTNVSMFFTSNSAHYGNAIYVVDETYFDVCARQSNTINSTAASSAECFFQVLSQSRPLIFEPNFISIEFNINSSSRSTIVGGLLDRCIPDPHAQIITDGYTHKEIDGVTYLRMISNMNDTRSISSSPVRLCFCTIDDQPDCSYDPVPPGIQVKKGESFNVSLVAVDQVNHTVMSVMIYSSLNHVDSGLGEGQLIQMTNNACTNLTFSVVSPYASEQLILYAEGPCRNASRSQRRVYVTFLPCICPIGFQPNQDAIRKNCECVCDSKLSPFFTGSNCNHQTESLVRSGNFWIDFINDTNDVDNSSGYLIYPHCPLDYCLPPEAKVQVNLNTVNGADIQCANNRSGMLCGVCQPGLSLSLSSSRCITCSKPGYKYFVSIVIITLIAGVILVCLLMVLNLTVAVGTLNGVIFCANIIGANSSMFFPSKIFFTFTL